MQAFSRRTSGPAALVLLLSSILVCADHAMAWAGGEGIDLSWGDCGTAGTQDQNFACNTNAGSLFTMTGSFSPPPGVNELMGMTATLTVLSSTATLPDWWKHGASECRGLTGLSVSFDFTAGPNTCEDPFSGAASGGFSYDVGYGGPDRARLRMQSAAPFDNRAAVFPGTEYYAFKVNIHRSKSAGSGNCLGCSTPMTITLDSLQLFQPMEAAYDPILTQPLHRNVVTWQGAIFRPQVTSFTPHEGGEGTPVTVFGHKFEGATAVRFGNLDATFSVVADSIIETTAPNGVYTSRISVTTQMGTGVSDTLFQVGSPDSGAGINLSWDDCGLAGGATKSFACNLNSDPPFVLVASYRPSAGIVELMGLDGSLDVRTSSAALPDWWKFGSLYCRGTTGVSTSADFTAGPYSCADYWGGHATGNFIYDVGFVSPDRGRLNVHYAVPTANQGPLDPETEYYAFKVLLQKARTTGAGSCAGCSVPACIVLNQIQLLQPSTAGNNEVISNPLDRSFVTWQSDAIASCPASTAIQVSLVSADVLPDGVALVWATHDVEVATLQRRETAGVWIAIAHLRPDGSGRIRYEDHNVVRGRDYAYRLAIPVPAGEVFQGETEVHVPVAGTLALNGVRWTRDGRELIVSLSLPLNRAALLEIYDVNGRRLKSQRLENNVSGPSEVRMMTTPLSSGVFFVRLTQGAQRVGRRFVMVE